MTSGRSVALTAIAAALLSGCSTTFSSWVPSLPSIPPPSFGWLFGKSNKPGPLPALSATATPRLNWQVSVGKATSGLAPAITQSAVFAAANDGTVVRVDAASGRVVWRINVGQKIAAGPGADEAHVVVGTDKGAVHAFDKTSGASGWKQDGSEERSVGKE
jgi:outer membrane protein assembly factor BamB